MKFLLSWLKEFIELSLPPESLAERLTLSGLEVTSRTRVDGDWLFEAEVTPNRPDLLSHLGIARETAAALGRPFRFPRRLQKELRLPAGSATGRFPVTVEDPEGCPFYSGLVIRGVRVGPSPPELATRLLRLGIRPVNNVVDVTNLCLFELGQPLHAFDLEKLAGPSLVVRRARSGEKLETIDGVSRTLDPDLLVIADAKKPVALAGILGGKETEIGPQTRQIFLESALFQPALIRRGTRKAKVSTDSSYRFERGVHAETVPLAALRAARWITRLGSGTIDGPLLQIGNLPVEQRVIPLKPKKAQAVLGIKSSPAQQRRLLESVGCRIRGTSRGWKVEPPTWRSDLKIPEDLYEEIVRLVGYDRCPASLPAIPRQPLDPAAEQPVRLEDETLSWESRLRQLLVGAGAQEILTYSLVGEEALNRCHAESELRIRNPLSAEQVCLRPTLLPGMLGVLSLNFRRKTKPASRLFELGRVYGRRDGGLERRVLGLMAAGVPDPSWNEKPPGQDLFQIKGLVRFLAERLNVDEFREEIRPASGPFEGEQLEFLTSSGRWGSAGNLRSDILQACELPADWAVAYAELELEGLPAQPQSSLRVRLLAKIAPVVRDLAVVVAEETGFGPLNETILESGRPLLRESVLFDLYRGKQVSSGKKSLALRLIFSDGDRALAEEEVNAAVQRILSALQEKFQASLRQ